MSMLEKDPEKMKTVQDIFDGQLDLGVLELVPEEETPTEKGPLSSMASCSSPGTSNHSYPNR